MPLVGIANQTGTACHLNAAMQILAHNCHLGMAFSTRHKFGRGHSDAAFGAQPRSQQKQQQQQQLWNILQDFLTQLTSRQDDVDGQPLDPTFLYEQFSTTLGLQAHDFGDAVMAITKILHWIAATLEEDGNYNTHHQWIHDLFHCGRYDTTIIGQRRDLTSFHSIEEENVEERTKILSDRILPNPFCISLSSYTQSPISLESALQGAFGGEQGEIIEGYQWEEEEEVDNGNDHPKSTSAWKTIRRRQVEQWPPILMIHIQRPHAWWKSRDSNTVSSLQIPWHLELSSSTQQQSTPTKSYRLTGGIIHVSDDSDEKECDVDDEELHGHYVAVIQHQTSNAWYCLDDESVELVNDSDADMILRWLGGLNDTTVGDNEKERCGDKKRQHGVLLVYEQRETVNSILQNMNSEHATADQQSTELVLPQVQQCEYASTEAFNENVHCDWIGRRIRVRWKGGNHYDGTITSYDDHAQTHTITYDDGDVRKYNLQSLKTSNRFEWIDDISPTADMTDPQTTTMFLREEMWVGRRLQVQWSQGKWYSGVITSYDTSTGKHAVTYDDGDVRQYNLAKKKIEWLDELKKDTDQL